MPLFDVPTAKSHPTLIARDEQQFAVLAATLERTLAELTDRLDQERRAPARGGTAALERDQEVLSTALENWTVSAVKSEHSTIEE